MILGIGTDIIKVSRFEVMSEHFTARVFTTGEQAYILKKGPESAAGIFAAKEAVAKALGTGFSGFWPSDIEVSHNIAGKPYVILHGKAVQVARRLARGKRRFARGYSIELSISHTSENAVAFVVVSAR